MMRASLILAAINVCVLGLPTDREENKDQTHQPPIPMGITNNNYTNEMAKHEALWMYHLPDALIRIGELQSQLKSIKATLNTFVQWRSAIESLEHKTGADADIDYSKAPKSNKFYERSRYIRKMKWIWILENVDYYKIADLKSLIMKSEDFATIADFAEGISLGYCELSKIIQISVLRPGGVDLVYEYSRSSEPKAKRAVELFMNLYDIRDYVVIPRTSKVSP